MAEDESATVNLFHSAGGEQVQYCHGLDHPVDRLCRESQKRRTNTPLHYDPALWSLPVSETTVAKDNFLCQRAAVKVN